MRAEALILICFCLIGLSTSSNDTSHLPPCIMENQNRHFPSGFDCPSYFTCFYEEYVLQQCPEGFWFERTHEVCDLPHNVFTCEFAPPPAPPETTTLATTTRRPNPVDCAADGVAKLPNPYSCTRFFMCFDGVAVERSCSPGLYFSRSQLRCVRRAESDCLLDGETCPATNDPDNIVFLPDQQDCQIYYVCYDGAPVEFDCGETLHWDPLNNWCIREEDSECEPSYPLPEVREIECPEDTGSDIIFLPHPEECQFYFICLDGESTLARCGRNLLFDYILANCFFAESARCFNRVPNVLRLK